MNIIEQIKLLLLIRKEIKKIQEVAKMKPGIKSTEFWLTVISVLATIYSAVQGYIPAETGLKIVAIVSAVYTVARTIVKLTPSTSDDELLDKIEAIVKEKLGSKIN